MILTLFAAFLYILSSSYHSNAVQTGFWYGDSRPPNYVYDSVPYANLTMRIVLPYEDGPGQNLITDPENAGRSLFVGNTINRQTFDTQFVLDLNYAVGIDVARVYVLSVQKGKVHFTWESTSVIVNFIFLERNSTQSVTLLQAVADLTNLIQTPTSKVYIGTNTTLYTDPVWGLQVVTWDMSLRLSYNIQVVGGDSVREGYYLDQGSLGICDAIGAANFSKYCEFQRFFEDDVALALNISSFRVCVLFIKTAALDAVYVYFRIQPPRVGSKEDNVTLAMVNLAMQVADLTSLLYKGNVTIRTDPTWGVSELFKTSRSAAPLFTLKYYDYDLDRLADPVRSALVTPYDRCKANRRCNFGQVVQDQNTNDVKYFLQLFERGVMYETSLFLDFEDWRLGCRGVSWEGNIPPTEVGASSIPRARANLGNITGALFWPFAEESLGPVIPSFLRETNQGLVLDRTQHYTQLLKQQSLVNDLKGRLDWLTVNIQDAAMGPELRSRYDVQANLSAVRADFGFWHINEEHELQLLNSSQCAVVDCSILFNTSSLQLTGAINATGVARTTANGTSVAVFTFASIYLGPEVLVQVVGQRALCLLSKTTAVINTTIQAVPGTLGGFPGGASVARRASDALRDHPEPIYICDLSGYCSFNTSDPSSQRIFSESLVSNNVNGPGSGNVRITPFIVETSAANIPEIQTITTSASSGQSLSGGFVITYRQFSTPILPFDASALQVKTSMEDNLNLVKPSSFLLPTRTDSSRLAGVGALSVSRSAPSSTMGYTWTVTFNTAIGDIPQVGVKSFLFANGANVVSDTVRNGNQVLGTFQLSLRGYTTTPIAANANAAAFKAALQSLPIVTGAYVIRTDPTGNCDDGLCPNGPRAANGLQWTAYIATVDDNVTPYSPSSALALEEGEASIFTAVTTSLLGTNASVAITRGMSDSFYSPQNVLNVSRPFSLAFGGAGGSHGGRGGTGFGINPPGPLYGDEVISDLLGGSGGQMSPADLFEINAALGASTGVGGAGGGALEIVAANDLIIGSYGQLIMRGGSGQQTSAGGAGGGSGGSILLSSATTIIVDGTLDVTGGNGGYGGANRPDLAGGGGGGGRIALYADSITTDSASIVADGGKCGVYRIPVSYNAAIINITTLFALPVNLDTSRISFLAEETIAQAFPSPSIVTGSNVSLSYSSYKPYGGNSTTAPLLLANVTIVITLLDGQPLSFTNATTADVQEYVRTQLQPLLGNNLAEMTLVQAELIGSNLIFPTTIILDTDTYPTCTNPGGSGSIRAQALMTTKLSVRSTNAAENTNRALYLLNNETTVTPSGTRIEAPYTANGPIIAFEASRPQRVTYYTKTDYLASGSDGGDFGSLFTLISRGEEGLNVSNVIGVFFGSAVMYGANFGSTVDEKVFLKRLVTLDPYPNLEKWYKVDIKIDWPKQTYSVALNDIILVINQPFSGSDVDGIRLSVFRAVNVWFDEIYVGFDPTIGFSCPTSNRTGTATSAPTQKGWDYESVHAGQGLAVYNQMTRHYNFLATTGSIPFDGQGQLNSFQDVYSSSPDGDYAAQQGAVYSGALTFLTGGTRTAKDFVSAAQTLVSKQGLWTLGTGDPGDGRQFWYSEFAPSSSVYLETSPFLTGGIAACSTSDLVNWRFEGFVLQYANLSDQVTGKKGPFTLTRPKVLYNAPTQQYVLWAAMDYANASAQSANSSVLAQSIVATAPYEDG